MIRYSNIKFSYKIIYEKSYKKYLNNIFESSDCVIEILYNFTLN